MKKLEFHEMAKQLLDQLRYGAFLTVKDKNDRLNTMTIAWGSLGNMWNRPVFTVMVRKSRYTYELIENAQDFTVSFPLNGQLKKDLNICGSRSGRDVNKFQLCGLTPQNAQTTHSPVIKECDLHLECAIVHKSFLESMNLAQDIISSCYKDNDFHAIYVGEIKACYLV